MFGNGVKHATVSTNQALHRQVIEHMEHATTAVDGIAESVTRHSSLSGRKRRNNYETTRGQADTAIHHLQAGREIGGVNGAAIQAIDDAVSELRQARSGVADLYWNSDYVSDPLARARTKIQTAVEEAADQTGFQNAQLKQMEKDAGLDLDELIPGEDLV